MPKSLGIPKLDIMDETPLANIWTGVALSDGFPKHAMASRARTATNPSINIAPYPMSLVSFSLSICLDEVPEETSEWKPEIAPHATVTNSSGNRGLPLEGMKLVKAGMLIVGLETNRPTTPPISIA